MLRFLICTGTNVYFLLGLALVAVGVALFSIAAGVIAAGLAVCYAGMDFTVQPPSNPTRSDGGQ
ncbi:hypothetical protein acdb102_31150 [Acidothermaceae bacterium B102]|nr:hypothetical protein acdb102_31150 [Acidothermaceae bacterium B102]